MPFVPVIQYQADWNPKNNTYQIQAIIKPGGNPVTIPINTEVEYVAVLLMMGKAGVLVDTGSGDIRIPPRPVGT